MCTDLKQLKSKYLSFFSARRDGRYTLVSFRSQNPPSFPTLLRFQRSAKLKSRNLNHVLHYRHKKERRLSNSKSKSQRKNMHYHIFHSELNSLPSKPNPASPHVIPKQQWKAHSYSRILPHRSACLPNQTVDLFIYFLSLNSNGTFDFDHRLLWLYS